MLQILEQLSEEYISVSETKLLHLFWERLISSFSMFWHLSRILGKWLRVNFVPVALSSVRFSNADKKLTRMSAGSQ